MTIRGIDFKFVRGNLSIAIISHGFIAIDKTVEHYAKKIVESS